MGQGDNSSESVAPTASVSSSSSRHQLGMPSSYKWSTGSSNGSSGTRPSNSHSGEEGPDILFSPNDDDDQYYAQETPSEHRLSQADALAAATETEKALQAIRRYKLDVDSREVWDQVDIAFLNQLLFQPSRLTAVFITAGDTHRVARSDGPMPDSLLSPRLIADLAAAVAEKQQEVVNIADLGQFFEDRGIGRDQLPADINYFSGSLLRFSPRHGDPEVPVGLVASFDCDAQHASQNEKIVEKVVYMTHTILRNAFLTDRRKIELRAQQEMVNLTRLIQGDGSDGNGSTLGHDGDDQVDAQSDARRIKKSASPDIEHTIFKQASRATARVLRADLVAIFDISGFKYDKAPWTKRRGPSHSNENDNLSDEDYGPTPSYEESRTRSVSNVPNQHEQSAPGSSRTGQINNGSNIADLSGRNTVSASKTALLNEDSELTSGRSSSSDSDGGGTDRQDDYDRSRQEPLRRPELLTENENERYGMQQTEPQGESIVCSYTKSTKPIPLLAASGRGKSHFQLLPGELSRPLVAKFLASARAAGTPWLSHVEGEKSPLSSEKPLPPRVALLSDLLPNGLGGLVALPVFETTQQPAYLILAVFKDAPPAFEDSDRLFVEQIGSSLIASALRIRSQAVDRAQVRLTQRMQHQLRTPLHTIVGMCESAKFVLECSQETHKMIASIALSAEALDASLSDIFDYSVMAGIKEPKIARTAIWPMTNFRGLFEITSRTSNAAWRLFCLHKAPLDEDRLQIPPPPELIVTCGPGSWDDLPVKFKFDCEALTRVVSKLVTNALQATARGIVCVNLAIKPTAGKKGEKGLQTINELHLTVSDTGAGMSKDFLRNHVFRPFTKALENTQGTGLSLSICSSVMSRLGGRVHVTSEVNKGSSFDFVFPFRGDAGASIRPTGVKVACIPLNDDDAARVSFVAFVTFLAKQFGAEYLGSVDKSPELLDHVAILFVAGERTEKVEDKKAIAELIESRTTRRADQVIVELPNRAFFDPPNSLKSERKIIKIGNLDAIQIYRPFVLPDLELMEEIFADVLMDQERVSQAETTADRGSSAVPIPSSKAHSPPSDVRTSRMAKGSPSSIIGSSKKGSSIKSFAGSSRSNRSSNNNDSKPAKDSLPSGAAQSGFLCLVVEDNPLNARILTTLLKRVGVKYVQAKDGVEGVELFKKHLPQVVLLDINMPRMNGFEAAIEMRKVECPFYPRIIAVTALSMESDKLRGKECGIDDWLPKPVRLAQLAQDVKSWMEEGVWYDDVPREDVSDVSDPPPKKELEQFTIEKAEEPMAIVASAASEIPKDGDVNGQEILL